ncbi:hypothetical protein VHEMI09522 [[Torrubiella] hemipterigena]|uniref:Arylsulfotransferase n=1 Tax=[Torrubiella] hemipterigena TaxID=1531966 RepID=A0A0A1TQ67_9HYPO|nr:hypothetical protein VHEMI09522 [[Torrubiella] hemipterigena]
MAKPSPSDLPFDFFHIDSVQRGPENDYLVSAHHLDTVLSVSQTDGSIRWRLGGAKNDFADLSGGAATQFRRNHHAKWSSDGIITLFDQGSHSAKMLAVDVSTRTAMLVQEYKAPEHMALSASRGSVQVLDSGNVLVGWGTVPVVTEYSAEGELLCDTRFGPLRSGWVQNYRAYKFPWKGRPQTVPDVVVDDADAEEQDAVYVSWNGATDVISWKLESASWTGSKWTGYQLHEVLGSDGFETRVKLPVSAGPMIRVTALGEGGSVLGWSKDVLLRNRAPALVMERKRRTAIKGIVCCTLVSTGALALAVSTIWKMIKKRRARLGMTGHRYMPLYSAKKGDA